MEEALREELGRELVSTPSALLFLAAFYPPKTAKNPILMRKLFKRNTIHKHKLPY
jgi:hypothetical protein